MWFSLDNLVLILAQAACVALPAAGLPAWTERFRTRAWALVLPLSIVVVVVAIELVPSTADVLTWVALLLVPPGCALALGWAAHGARAPLALLAPPLLALAWASPDTRAGQLAAIVLIAGSAITLGRLLAGAAPLSLLKAGVVAMAAVDAYLVFSNKLQAPNAVLVAAAPGSRACPSSSRRPSTARAWATATSSRRRSSGGSSPRSADRSSRPPPGWSSSRCAGTSSSSSTTCCRRRSRRPSC